MYLRTASGESAMLKTFDFSRATISQLIQVGHDESKEQMKAVPKRNKK
jgi:hypothetical protein